MAALDEYHAHRARLDALESRYTPKVRRALVRSVERCAAAVEAGGGIDMAAALVDRKPVEEALALLYVGAGLPEAKYTYASLTEGQKAQAPPTTATNWADRLKRFITTEGAAAVRGITETTRKLVRAVLSEAAEAGDSVQVAARKLRARVAQVSKERAVAIVRTELVAAGNYGSLVGAQATGLKLEKWWMATPDGRTRPSHAVANGQGAPLQDGLFTVGGEHCRYPGDPVLSVGERARCRCAIAYRSIK
jgi:hypothetical protein